MQISITRDKYHGHAKSPWLVVLPARLSPTGRRQYRRFATRGAAAEFVAAVKQYVRQRGEHQLTLLPASLAADATAAAGLLAGMGLSLCDAVQRLLSLMRDSNMAFASLHHIGGNGGQACRTAAATSEPSLTLKTLLPQIEAAKTHQSMATTRTRRSMCHTLFSRNQDQDLENMPLCSITPAIIERALHTAWPNSPSTFNGARRYLHAMFAFAIKKRFVIMENPVSIIDQQHVTESEIHALTPDALRNLLASCRPPTSAELQLATHSTDKIETCARTADLSHLRAHVALCAFAGVRPTECTRLRWQDIDFEDGIISVRSKNSKTGGTRHIDLHPTLRAWLTACRPPDADPADFITPQASLTLHLSALRRRAGYNNTNPWQNDCLRHSYASYYLKAKIGSIGQLQLNMGHRSSQLIYTRYMNLAGVTRASAAAWWSITPGTITYPGDCPQ